MKVTVLDIVTGEKENSEGTQFEDCDVYWWTEGNGACDCNRAKLFSEKIDNEMDGQMRLEHPELKEWQSININTVCYGEKRFLIIEVEPMPEGYTLEDFNDGYPNEMIEKYIN